MLPETQFYTPPPHYQNSHQGASESSDFIPLFGSQSKIIVGGIPLVGIDNISIAESVTKTPIYTLGMLEALAFEQQNVSVNISGTLVQNARMSMAGEAGAGTEFYPQNPAQMMEFLNSVFDIELVLQKPNTPEDPETTPVFTAKNCQRTGSNISVPNGKIIDSFSIIGAYLERDFATLANFYPREV